MIVFDFGAEKFHLFVKHSKTEIAKSRLIVGMEIELEQVF